MLKVEFANIYIFWYNILFIHCKLLIFFQMLLWGVKFYLSCNIVGQIFINRKSWCKDIHVLIIEALTMLLQNHFVVFVL